MQPVNFGYPCGQRLQLQAFDREEFPRNRANVLFIGGVDAVAP
jgi:hypothetical protein